MDEKRADKMVKYPSVDLYIFGVLVLIIMLTACGSSTATLVPSPAIIDTPIQSPTPGETLDTTSTSIVGLNSVTAPTAAPDNAVSSYQSVISAPSGLSLSGKLLLSDYNLGIARVDFSTGKISQVFHSPENGFVGAAVLSPDSQTFFMVYSRPRDLKDPQYGSTGLYTLPIDGSGQPSPLLKEDNSGNYYFSPLWSSDSHSLYYGRLYDPYTNLPAT